MTSKQALKSAKEEQQELEALHRLDEECVYQQQAGDYLKAFDCMERALVLRRHFFGADSPEVLHACKALAEMCNLLSMSFLQQDNYAVTIDLLKKAEILTKHHPSEKATTLNNLACYYRRLGKLHASMTCLKRALELEKKLQDVRNAADTHLNLCAVLSQLGKHQQALEQAQEALIVLQEEFFQSKQTNDSVEDAKKKAKKKNPGHGDDEEGESGAVVGPSASGQQIDRVSVMCIAYHNIGVEQEFLKDYANSVMSYKKGVGLAEQYLGIDHAITTTVRNSYLAAKRTISTKSPGRNHRGTSATGGAPLDAPLSSKSPGKALSRLLNSPRSSGSSSLTNSLRLPSPLAKEKQRHNIGDIPSPRSIVADVLSKGATLPPLGPGRSPMRGGVLSPRDPFFSPRFRFNGGCGGNDGEGGNGDDSVSKSSMSVKKSKKKEVKFEAPPSPPATEQGPLPNSNSAAISELEAVVESPPPGAHVVDMQFEQTPISSQDDLISTAQDLVFGPSVQVENPEYSTVQATADETRTTEDTLRVDPTNLSETSPTSAFQLEDSPPSFPAITGSRFAEINGGGGGDTGRLADFDENFKGVGDASEPLEAEKSTSPDTTEHTLESDPTLEDPPFTKHDGSIVALSLQEQTVGEADAGEPTLLSAVPANDDVAQNDRSAASIAEAAEASFDHEADAQIDPQIEEMGMSQLFDPEHLLTSAPAVEDPVSDESEGLEELPCTEVSVIEPAPNPDEPTDVEEGVSVVSSDDSRLRESDKHDEEDILGLLDESAEDGVHSMDRQDEKPFTSSELPVGQSSSDEAIGYSEVPSLPEISHIQSVETQQSSEAVDETPDSVVIDELAHEHAMLQEGDGGVVAPAREEGEHIDTDQFPPADAHEVGELLVADQNFDVSEAHAESAMGELVDPEYYSHDRQQEEDGGAYPLSEEPIDSHLGTEIDTVHSSETLAEHTTGDGHHEERPTEDNFALERGYGYPEEEQPVYYNHDVTTDYHLPQSEYVDASGQEAHESVGEFPYHHEEVDTTSASEVGYPQVAEMKRDETTAMDTHFKRNPSPDPVYDDQFEHEAAEESDHLHSYPHGLNELTSAEYSVSPESAVFEEQEGQLAPEGDATTGFGRHLLHGEHDTAFESALKPLEHHHEAGVGITQAPTVPASHGHGSEESPSFR